MRRETPSQVKITTDCLSANYQIYKELIFFRIKSGFVSVIFTYNDDQSLKEDVVFGTVL